MFIVFHYVLGTSYQPNPSKKEYKTYKAVYYHLADVLVSATTGLHKIVAAHNYGYYAYQR